MLKSNLVEVVVDGKTAKWYRSRGYSIPTYKDQRYYHRDGKTFKNGFRISVKKQTKIIVNVNDLMPSSNKIIIFICEACGKEFTTTWRAHKDKISNNCKSCQAKKGFKGGCQDYWVDKLIKNNINACCDISLEKDKRFLELHHLVGLKCGGKNEESNFIVLSANYHRAFHNSLGGTNAPFTKNDYFNFKINELKILQDRRLTAGEIC